MKCVLILCLFFAAVLSEDAYKYGDIDFDEILKNERLYKQYFACLTNNGKCTPDGKDLKDVLPDALSTDCAKCSPKQKAGADKVVKYLIDNKPEDFAELEKLYDPEGVYRKKYDEEHKADADKN